MDKFWKYLNNAIAVLNVLVGILIISIAIFYFNEEIKFTKSLAQNEGFAMGQQNVFYMLLRIFKLFPLLEAFILLASGFTILIKRKFGWILGYIGWSLVTLFLIQHAIYGIGDVTTTIMDTNNYMPIFLLVAVLISCLLIVIFSLKPFRNHHNIDAKSWNWVLSMIILFEVVIPKLI